MKESIFHSVALLEEVCIGCTACLQACPTEAIRLREGKARIMENRCIDCGVCIRTCPVSAKIARTNEMHELRRFSYNIAVVPPELYSQFGDDVTPEMILRAILKLGFDEVFEVAMVSEEITLATKKYLERKDIKRPVLSFNCPAVVRLITVRFPDLVDHLLPLKSPMGVAGKRLRESRPAELGLSSEKVGIFYITPCPARMTRIRQPMTESEVYYNGAISIADIYGDILIKLKEVPSESELDLHKSGGSGIGWGAIGGESKALLMEDCMYVDGMVNVLKIFEEIEKGELSKLNYLECMACTGGCVGGPLMVDNVFIARNKIKKLRQRYEDQSPIDPEQVIKLYREGRYHHQKKLELNLIDPLDSSPVQAIKKMKERKHILDTLPGIDCGACGAPNCRALAEDVVQGRAKVTDCIFVLFEQANEMAQRVADWTARLPSSMKTQHKRRAEPEKLTLKEVGK